MIPSEKKEKARWAYVFRTYGISESQYRSLLKRQKGGCAVCGKTQSGYLDIDHDHKTGEIRGLLCRYCNHRVVGRHRKGGLLLAAGRYLERKKYTGWIVPPKPKRRKRRKAKK